jgi:anaphase-promoting complex subunit 4
VAAGFADGALVLVRTEDGALIKARDKGGAPVSAIGWAASGQMLAFGCEDGDAGVLSF